MRRRKENVGIRAVFVVGGVALAAGAAVLLLVLYRYTSDSLGGGSHAFADPQTVAEQFTEAAYAGAHEEIIDMLPKALKERSIADTRKTWELESEEEVLAEQGNTLANYLLTLDGSFGEGWHTEYELSEPEYFTAEELEDVNRQLIMMGVSDYQVNKAARVPVKLTITGINGTTGMVEFFVPAYRSGLVWNLGQYIGLGAMDTGLVYASRFGDLMDGFSIEGVYDADGKMLYDANGEPTEAGMALLEGGD